VQPKGHHQQKSYLAVQYVYILFAVHIH
jgi:hypothetical protein